MNYTGIGARNTPPEILGMMVSIASLLASHKCVLRSGGAEGADMAFEKGCDFGLGRKEIFLPWKGFNGNDSPLYNISVDANDVAEQYHPSWETLSRGARLMMSRNGYQILGKDLKQASDFVICYTEGGKMTGGTSQVLRIAEDLSIPVFNFGKYQDIQEMRSWLRSFVLKYLD